MKHYRISLSEDDYIHLVKTGKVRTPKSDIEISKIDFDKLIDGQIIEGHSGTQTYQIALQDIGYDRIFRHLRGTNIYV